MDDLISRQDAIDALDGEITVTGRANAEAVRGYARLVADRLKRSPSAQPERKKGKWKYETMRHIITGEMRTVRICSVCDGGWFRYDMSDGVEEAEPNLCPNCGADMRGEGDETD